MVTIKSSKAISTVVLLTADGLPQSPPKKAYPEEQHRRLWHAPTLTVSMPFVRAISQSGMPQALTGD